MSQCTHPEVHVVTIDAKETLVNWCRFCGSIRDNNGDHGVSAGTWRGPIDRYDTDRTTISNTDRVP